MEKEKEPTKAEAFGIKFADIVMEAAHMRYNAPSGKAIVKACIKKLQEKIGELQSKEVNPKCKKELTRAEVFGMQLADVAMSAAQLTEDVFIDIAIVKTCVVRLQERIAELQTKPAEPAYKKARYRKKKKTVKELLAKILS